MFTQPSPDGAMRTAIRIQSIELSPSQHDGLRVKLTIRMKTDRKIEHATLSVVVPAAPKQTVEAIRRSALTRGAELLRLATAPGM